MALLKPSLIPPSRWSKLITAVTTSSTPLGLTVLQGRRPHRADHGASRRDPKSITFAGKDAEELFNREGDLESVLNDKYLFAVEDADALTAFLRPIHHLDLDKRARTSELECHQWLDGVVLQGEIDVIHKEHEARLEIIPDV
ncbi:hypothetical protein DXG01_010833, partial [Tephrocybe rancida]